MKEYLDFGQRIIKIIRDVDFSVLKSGEIDNHDMCKLMFEPKHGTVVYVAGMVENNEDDLLCMGAEEGSIEFNVNLLSEIEEIEKTIDGGS